MESIEQHKRTVYIIGGISGAGKSTVAERLAREKSLYLIKTDVIRAATRNVVTGYHPDKHIQHVTFTGSATYQEAKNPDIKGILPIERTDQGEDDIAWLGVLGILKAFDAKKEFLSDILIEGVAAKPHYIHELTSALKNFEVRAIFIGFDGDDIKSAESAVVNREAEQYGFTYFDRKEYSPDEQFAFIEKYFQ